MLIIVSFLLSVAPLGWASMEVKFLWQGVVNSLSLAHCPWQLGREKKVLCHWASQLLKVQMLEQENVTRVQKKFFILFFKNMLKPPKQHVTSSRLPTIWSKNI
jgi:hypothetical protein